MQIVEIFSTDQQSSGWSFPPFHAVVIGFCLMELERGNNFIELDFNIACIYMRVCEAEQKEPRYFQYPIVERVCCKFSCYNILKNFELISVW